jgi:thioredoxin reductase/NAD-dependent dihydropyrimidine dehydrogenase PreA subunit
MQIELLIYVGVLVLIWAGFALARRRTQRRYEGMRRTAEAAGLTEPASLHPVVDEVRCVGSGACVRACPEQDVLGIINGRAVLVNPTRCIGHGACAAACPMDAITLVFGTAKRGVDIPVVRPNFETNVPGLFIAGELGGMGLIRNAIEQGRQAMDAIARLDGIGAGDRLDVVIVGAGPAGIAATLGAMERGLKAVTIEQDSLGGTVYHFPRGKLVMTAPARLPLVGPVRFTETSKEELLAFWRKVERDTGFTVHYQERLEDLTREADGSFTVTTTAAMYRARAVLLAIGRRGTPRKLDVPGEHQPKVVYRLTDPEQYRGRKVLVVGGGDSAMEAALAVAEQPDTTVTLSYRGEAFSRAKEKNRERVAGAVAEGRLTVLLESEVREITADGVRLERHGEAIAVANDAVIVCAGGVLPTPFLKKIGIDVETKFGTV